MPSVKIGTRRVSPVAALRDFLDRLIAEPQRSSDGMRAHRGGGLHQQGRQVGRLGARAE